MILLFGLLEPAIHVLAQENVFDYDDFSLTLPEGWVKEEISKGSGKEVVGSLKSEKIAGTTVLVLCYKGCPYHYSNVRIAGLKTLASIYPRGQETLKKGTKLKTEGGLTAVRELWRGAVDAGGRPCSFNPPWESCRRRRVGYLCWDLHPMRQDPNWKKTFLK
jgi:hypothetical protein